MIDPGATLFGRLVDHAGLLPPAPLDMQTAVAAYRHARTGPGSWIVGRFLVPATKLEELATVLVTTMTARERPWEVGVVVDTDLGSAVATAAAFHRELHPGASIVTAEARLDGGADGAAVERIHRALGAIADDVAAFVEVDVTGPAARVAHDVTTAAETITRSHRPGGVALRGEGPTPDQNPAPDAVAAFVTSATAAGVPFKATAGLDHPIRCDDASRGATHHGFVNLLVAAALAIDDAPSDVVTAAVADTDRSAFGLSLGGFRWRDRRFTSTTLQRTRSRGLIGYGSRDLASPVAELAAMGLIAAEGMR